MCVCVCVFVFVCINSALCAANHNKSSQVFFSVQLTCVCVFVSMYDVYDRPSACIICKSIFRYVWCEWSHHYTWCVCMYVYMCVYVCTYVWHACMYILCMDVCMHIHTYIWVSVRILICQIYVAVGGQSLSGHGWGVWAPSTCLPVSPSPRLRLIKQWMRRVGGVYPSLRLPL